MISLVTFRDPLFLTVDAVLATCSKLWAYLGDIAGLVPDYRNKVSITVKQSDIKGGMPVV